MSKITDVECTLNYKIGKLRHSLPVNDELKVTKIQPVRSKMADKVIACMSAIK